jgi:hypothetical protein
LTSKTTTHGDEDHGKDTTSLLEQITYEQRTALERKKKRVITLKDGRTRIYTPPNSFPPKPIIEAAREIYRQLKELGQDRVTVRTWHYNLIDIESLNLRYSEGAYKIVSKVLANARRGKYGEAYRLPYSWFIDKKRTPAPERPWMTPQQFADDLKARVRYTIESYPFPMFYNQNKYYVVIMVEKDTLVVPIQQLVKKIFGGKPGDENQIPVIDCGGFGSVTHKRNIYTVLKKQENMGRKILVFYIGDWDPSGIFVDRDVDNVLRKEWKLKNFELKRIAVTGDQVRELKLFKAKDPKTLEKLYRDTRHKEFMKLNDGELFQTEADAILKAAGLREIKRIIEQDIIKKYWDKKKWKRYENIFTVGKVQLRFVKAMGELTTEILGDSEIEDSIDNALEKMSLGYESDELIQIEGDSYKEPIDEESGMYAVNEDDVGDDEDDELE